LELGLNSLVAFVGNSESIRQKNVASEKELMQDGGWQ
jgi:hypothetical protein